MANLVDVVNTVLRRQGLINSTTEYLTDFSDTSIRIDVDSMVDAINDVLRYVFDVCEITPYGFSEATFTLVEGTRSYAPAANFHVMSSDFIREETKGHLIQRHPHGYRGIFEEQTQPQNYEGQAISWAMDENRHIYLDRIPTASQNGDVYTYLYRTQLNYSNFDDVLPFTDMIIRDLTPAFVQMYKRQKDAATYDEGIFLNSVSMGVASIQAQPVADDHA